MSKPKISNRKPFLVMRFGGMGDIMFCTPIIKELHDEGFDVHVATNDYSLPLLENNPYVGKSWSQTRDLPGMNIENRFPADLTQMDGFLMPTIGLYDRYVANTDDKKETRSHPLNVVNYFRIIENNSLHDNIWPTQGADFINTYDNHFSWANIDPQSIPSTLRRPQYFPKKEELEWASSALQHFPRPIVLLQPYASSPVRTYYRLTEVLDVLRSHPVCTVILWEPAGIPQGGYWRVLFFNRDQKCTEVGRVIPWPDKSITPHSIRATAALIAQADLLLSADTCVSHLAEAVKTYHLTYYTSVPAWTRSRDYEYEFTLDSRETIGKKSRKVCKCGIIGRDCPRKNRDSFMLLSKREQEILSLLNQGEREQLGIPVLPPVDTKGKNPHEYFETTPQALQEELKSAVSHFESGRQCEAPCSKSLNVAQYLKEVLESERFLSREGK